jgi:hypothetical protein
MKNKDLENFVNWLQSLTAKKFYSKDAEDLIKEYKNTRIEQNRSHAQLIKNRIRNLTIGF